MDQIAFPIETSVRPANRLRRWNWLRLLAGLLLLWALLSFQAKVPDIIAAVSRSTPGWIVLAGSLHALGLLLSVWRWRLLLLAQKQDVPLLVLLHSYLTAAFFNFLLPARVSGDIYRLTTARRSIPSAFTRLAVILAEGGSSLCVLLLICAVSVLLNPSLERIALPVTVLAGVCLIVIALLITPGGASVICRWIANGSCALPERMRPALAQAAEVMSLFCMSRRKVCGAFCLSALLQGNVILYYYLICRGLGAGVSLAHLCLVVPLVIFVQLLPLTPNSIGVREVAFVYLLRDFAGITAAQALTLCVWDYVLTFAYALLGGLVYLIHRAPDCGSMRRQNFWMT